LVFGYLDPFSSWLETSPPESWIDLDDDYYSNMKIYGICKRAAEELGVAMLIDIEADEIPSSEQVNSLMNIVMESTEVDSDEIEEVSAYKRMSLFHYFLCCPYFFTCIYTTPESVLQPQFYFLVQSRCI
jgi:hypothetical protein